MQAAWEGQYLALNYVVLMIMISAKRSVYRASVYVVVVAAKIFIHKMQFS